jgi:hypothetical protein
MLGNALDGGNYLTRFFATILSIDRGEPINYHGYPFSYVFYPIFDGFEEDTRTVVGVMFMAISWANYFTDLLPDNIKGVKAVLDNGCDSPMTFLLNGAEVLFLGEGDLHDTECKFDLQRAIEIRILFPV